MRNSLRARILFAMLGLVIIGFAALTILAGRQLSVGTLNDYKARMVEQSKLIARGLYESVEHLAEGEASPATLESSLRGFGAQFGTEVALLRGNGRYWLGEPISSTLPPQAAPEVAAAMLGQATENTRVNPEGQLTVYAAAPVFEEDHLLAIVHLASPLTGAQTLVWQRWISLAAGFVVLAIVAAGISLWLSRSLTRPLARLRESALQIAQGDFSQRLPENRKDEIGQLAGAFNFMAGQVEAMIEEQRTFAGNASHELRTPLTTIRLRSEALRDGILDQQTARQYIVEIDDETARLGNLVDDLILVSRLDSGRMEAGQEEIDILRFVRHLTLEFEPLVEEKKLQLVLQAADQLPAIKASLSHLQVVFRNLLMNAVKYTPSGGQILWTISANDGHFHSVISDTGQGIDPADRDHLFERFYRADKTHSREIPGVGLGLSLVKMIVEVYGGSIAIDSPGLGQGTTVTVLWPYHLPEISQPE